MSNEKSASKSKLLSIGDKPWGSSPEGEVSPDPLPRGIFNGEMVIASEEAVVLFFYPCFKLRAFSLTVERSSQATWLVVATSKPLNPKPEPASTKINFGVRGKGWSWGGTRHWGSDFSAWLLPPCFVPSRGEELEALEVEKHHHHYDRHRSRAKLSSQLLVLWS
jgi:hypothetical protein